MTSEDSGNRSRTHTTNGRSAEPGPTQPADPEPGTSPTAAGSGAHPRADGDAQAGDLSLRTKEGRKSFWTNIVAVWLGTTMEYVDFALYGLASGLVFGDVFFPGQTPVIALLSSFATYAVGFIARPIGALVLGRVGDKKGRKFIMVFTVLLMGLSTTALGLLPTYQQVGMLAPILLLVCRLCQGFGAGAELSGGAVMLAEYAPVRHRGLVSSLIGVGSNTGTLLASGVWLLVLLLPHGKLIAWGWRIPFVVSILIALFAVYLRQSMQETPAFRSYQENRKKEEAILARSGKAEAKDEGGWKAFFVMLGLRIGENGPSYIAQSFLVGYVVTLGVTKSVPTTAVLIASVLGFAVIPFSGWLSDRFGRRITYRAFCALLAVYAFPAFWLLQSRNVWTVSAVIIVGMCLGSLGIFGVQAAYGVELFGIQHRYSRMAVAKELGSILSGGTAPMVASALLAATGSWVPLAAYFCIMAAIGLVTTFLAPETRGRDLTLVEDAI
ncbi:MFS transporter [Bifidobacterium xylocopae]|uniref:MFS transporter n=1 Tax=Bifidobacterium xylocopae TaxID=2493119 RepID=A0A366KCF7_9BIFI|nr:MFS transporter [Bifidobacterium xylocopae]RBP98922.1 MFS transporter [Bifidobacterium xylocopae]